jgi:hypothetical protein
MTHVADHALPVAARLPVVEDEALYQLIKRTDINASDVEDLASTAVEVSVLWKSAILHVAHLSAGQRFSLSSVTPTLPSPTRRMAPGLAAGAVALAVGTQGVGYAAGVGAAITAATLGVGMHAHLQGERVRTDPTRFVVDRETLGCDEAVVIRHEGGARFVFPAGAQGEVEIDGVRRSLAEIDALGLARPAADDPTLRELAFVPGGRYRLDLGELSVVAKEVRAARRLAPVLQRDPVMGRVALGTGVVMAALMGVVRLAVPDAGMLSSEDRDTRMELLRSAVERAMEREPVQPPPEPQQGAAAGSAHQGPNGAMGDRRSTADGRYGIQRRQPTPSIPRTRDQAARSGILALNLGIGAAAPTAGNTPSSPFGALVASGNDERDANGRMDGPQLGEGSGYDGLDGVGTGWGGGGDGTNTIGVGRLGTLGNGGDCREGQNCDHGLRAGSRLRDRRTHYEVTARPPQVSAGISPEVIRRVVLRNLSQVNRCYEQGLSTNPHAAGRVSVRFVIAPGGSVLGAAVADDTVGIPAVGECIAGAVRRWNFTVPADSGAITVTYPFSLLPADG